MKGLLSQPEGRLVVASLKSHFSSVICYSVVQPNVIILFACVIVIYLAVRFGRLFFVFFSEGTFKVVS